MKFLDFLKKFLIFSLKEIYSFFLKMSLFIFVIFIIGISAIAIFSSKDKNEKMKKSYEYILFNVSDVTEDKIVGSNFLISSSILADDQFIVSKEITTPFTWLLFLISSKLF